MGVCVLIFLLYSFEVHFHKKNSRYVYIVIPFFNLQMYLSNLRKLSLTVIFCREKHFKSHLSVNRQMQKCQAKTEIQKMGLDAL